MYRVTADRTPRSSSPRYPTIEIRRLHAPYCVSPSDRTMIGETTKLMPHEKRKVTQMEAILRTTPRAPALLSIQTASRVGGTVRRHGQPTACKTLSDLAEALAPRDRRS